MKISPVVFCVALLVPAGAEAQTRVIDELRACAGIGGAAERLACYDAFMAEVERIVKGQAKVAEQAPVPADDVVRTSVVDLKVDLQQLKGRTVQVTGKLMTFGDMVLLTDENSPGNPIKVHVAELPRDQRRDIVARCGGIMGCIGHITGTVGRVEFGLGIIASFINVDPIPTVN